MTRNRLVKSPSKYGEFAKAIDFPSSPKKERGRKQILWKVEKIISRQDGQVVVKWQGFGEEFNSWFYLADNPELAAFISANSGDPPSSALVKDLPALKPEEREFWLAKHAVFDALKFRLTPEQDTGLDRRVQVKVHFSQEGTFPLAKERGCSKYQVLVHC